MSQIKEQLVHSPKLIFNFKSENIFENYNINNKYYEKLLNTFKYIKNQIYKPIESKFWNEEQDIEIHRWLANNSYLEYRLFECENATDIVELDIFEDTDSTYQNLLVFQTREHVEGIYNKFIIGNDYFGCGYVYTEDFIWNLYDECNIIEIPRTHKDIEVIEHLRIDSPGEVNINNVIDGFMEMILLD